TAKGGYAEGTDASDGLANAQRTRSLSFSFFFNCPLIRPRTLCVCQPVARISSFSVAPFGRSSSAITRAVLLLAPARFCATRGGFLPELRFLTDRGRFGATALGSSP